MRKTLLISIVSSYLTLCMGVSAQGAYTYTTLDVPGGRPYLPLRHRRPPEGNHILATRGPRARPDDHGELLAPRLSTRLTDLCVKSL